MLFEGERRTVVAGCTGSALSIVANRDGSKGTLAVYTTDANSAAPGARGGAYMPRVFHLACAVSGLRKLKVDGLEQQRNRRRVPALRTTAGAAALILQLSSAAYHPPRSNVSVVRPQSHRFMCASRGRDAPRRGKRFWRWGGGRRR